MITRRRYLCRLRQSFFGLNEKYQEAIYEQFFFMKYYGGWSFTEAYNLPVKVRTWFVGRLADQLKQENEELKKSSKKS